MNPIIGDRNNADPILITGVGRRIGLALAEYFLDQGLPVVGTYRIERDSLALLKEKGAFLYQCDFYRQEDLSDLIQQIQFNHPKLQTIIHNASDWMAENSDYRPNEIMQRMMSIHVSAPYQLNIALADNLKASLAAQKNIIHISDYVSQKGSKKHIAYAASKAAMDNLTLSFAQLLAPAVRVNSIAPSLILFNDNDSDVYKSRALSKSLLGIEPGTAEIINTVTYLLTSSYITGRTLYVDGGRHLTL